MSERDGLKGLVCRFDCEVGRPHDLFLSPFARMTCTYTTALHTSIKPYGIDYNRQDPRHASRSMYKQSISTDGVVE